MKHGEFPQSLQDRPHLPDGLTPYWTAFHELEGMLGRFTLQDVESWMRINGIVDPDYAYFLIGMRNCRSSR